MRRQRLRHRARGFGALGDEVLGEEVAVRGVFVKVLRSQHHREHRHAGIELHAHQAFDDGMGHEIVAVNAAIDHQRASHDGLHVAALGEGLREALDG